MPPKANAEPKPTTVKVTARRLVMGDDAPWHRPRAFHYGDVLHGEVAAWLATNHPDEVVVVS